MPGSAGTPDPEGGRRLALIVATSTYADPVLRQLRAPASDAEALDAVLADPEIGGFAVTTVIDGTAQDVRLAVDEFLADRRPDDLLLVYLSCHGLVDLRRRLYFAATDTRKDRLTATGVEAQWVLDQLDDCRARRQIVVLDCCFSGAFAARAKSGDTDLGLGERFSGGRGRVVLTASRASEYSFEGKPLPGSAISASVFTSALVDGLRSGRADLDGDGWISVDDAYGYVFDQIRSGDAQQTPQRWLYGTEGSIMLARSPSGDAPPLVVPPARRRPRFPFRLSRPVLAGLGAALALGVALALFLVLHDGSGATGSAWRLTIEDSGSGAANADGCSTVLTNKRTKETRTIERIFGAASFHLQDYGQWTWTSNSGCHVEALQGAGEIASLPLTLAGVRGDSQAFRADGKVTITIQNMGGGESMCHLDMYSLADGSALDSGLLFGSGQMATLDPHGVSPVYLSYPYCTVRITKAG